METNSCIEKSDLREELKQARKKIKALEATVASAANMEDRSKPPAKNIVPFAAIEERLSPPRDLSPYDDPADFAMLLESEDACPPVPSPKVKAPPDHLERTATVTSKQKEQRSVNDNDSTFDIPERLDQPQFTRKRKAVNFEAEHPEGSVTEAGGSRQNTGQDPRGQEERPSKASGHVHKWTYSRIHTTSTEIQQEQSTGPGVAPKSYRRTSPKGLMSASSASNAAGKPNTRSRGRRRSRGMMNEP